MTTFYVSDMMCTHCVAKIEKGMAAAELDARVSLDTKTVEINGCQHCAAKAEGILKELGFTPERKEA